jgi:uncharacterized phage-associated protein
MATAHDVASLILAESGQMTAMKLQKLVYYAQAWSLVRLGAPLFDSPIQAWKNGPVSPVLYAHHRGDYRVTSWPLGDRWALTESQRDLVARVLRVYGPKSPEWLSDLTHRESPWIDARAGLAAGERGSREIAHDVMLAYYGSADTTERQAMMAADNSNPLIDAFDTMSDDDAAILDELAERDRVFGENPTAPVQ